MSAATTPAASTPTIVIKRHHFHWGIALTFLVIAGLVIAVYYLAGGDVHWQNGRVQITQPSLDTLHNRVQIVQQPNGDQTITVPAPTVQSPAPTPAQQQVLQPTTQPNGQTTIDGIGADNKLQRAVTDRYDPIDRLSAKIDENTAATNKAVATLGDSLKTVAATVDTLSKHVNNSFNGLSGKIDAQGTTIGDLTTRVAKLEAAPAQPAPAPQPAPQAQSAPAPQTPAPVETAPVPQASMPAQTRTAGNFVSPHGLSRDSVEMREMLQAYKDLGPTPHGARLSGFQQIGKNEVPNCPDGTPPELVRSVRDGHGLARRWACHHH